MHEFSLMEATLELVSELVPTHSIDQIISLTLRVGEASGVVPEALGFAFEALAEQLPYSSAKLKIELVPVRCCCQSCQFTFAPESFIYECPNCGNLHAEVLQGKELELVSIELDSWNSLSPAPVSMELN